MIEIGATTEARSRYGISKQRMSCKCGEVFDAEVVMPAPINVYLASAEAIHCPACGLGWKHLFLGGAHKDAPPLTASIDERATWWINRGETGNSSLAIWSALRGIGTFEVEGDDWPNDPDDFKRCKQLLDLIPEWRSELGKVALVFPWFGPFSDRWTEFEKLWEEERSSGSYPKLYNALKESGRKAKRRTAR